MNNTELEILKKLRGFLPEKLYLGGSHALKKFFFGTEYITPNDLDFFYYGKRPMEKWVLLNAFRSLGFDTVKIGVNYDGKYKIPGQYWYIRGAYKGLEFDVIFIDPDRMYDGLGSTLAGIQYQVTYDEEQGCLSTPTGDTIVDKEIRRNMRDASVSRRVTVFKEQCTDSQLKKVEERCRLLGLRLRSF